jgi:hypothetical protein
MATSKQIFFTIIFKRHGDHQGERKKNFANPQQNLQVQILHAVA